MRRCRIGVLGPPTIDIESGVTFWDVLRVLTHHLDEFVPLDDIITEGNVVYNRKSRSQVRGAISKLRKQGYQIESMKNPRAQISYCWAGGKLKELAG